MILSTRFKEAFKTALAMAIAYGIALSLDWDNPKWAGFAVAVIGQATVGQSLNKGAMRMLGTLIAAGVALTLIALFPQDRWPFILCLSAYVGFCTYMMGDAKRQYFWFVSAFVCVIIALEAAPNAVNAFDTAILRAEETGLGILVYSLVAFLLWPTSSRANFDAAARRLADTQHRLYRIYLEQMRSQGSSAETKPLRALEIQQHSQFDQLLGAAETDSYEIWELRHQWRRYRRQVADLTATMERWRESFAEVQALDLWRLLPDLAAFGDELDRRFTEIGRLLADQPPEQQPKILKLAVDKSEVRSLSHFHKAAVAVTLARLRHLESLTRSLFDTLSDIKGFGRLQVPSKDAGASPVGPILDLDRLTSVVRVMAALWLAFFALIYINNIPGGVGFVIIVTVFGMQLATTPQLRLSMLFVPVAVSLLLAGLVYVFVMPQLSTYTALGGLIFAATFMISYLFAAPGQVLGRLMGLAVFIVIISVSNEQTYNFLAVANTALMFPLAFLLLAITAYIPASPRPERTFLRLLRRLFRSCEYLLSTMRWEPQRSTTRLDRWRKAFHGHEIATLPRKLEVWAGHINEQSVPGLSSPQVQTLVTSLEGLSFRMQELVEARNNPQSDFLVQELVLDVRAWRFIVQRTFGHVSEDPAAVVGKNFRTKLAEIVGDLETRVEATMNKAGEGQIETQDRENLYRLLGAFRGVSEALVDFSEYADEIDWVRLREPRF